jgi:glyoxylase-like metal-dependent hydrolase (beta-lactamase superfamily II)
MHKKIFTTTIFLFSIFFVSAQDDMDASNENNSNQISNENRVGIQRVKDSIYIIKGRGGNIGISVGKDGIFMIDDKFEETSISVMERIRSVSDKPIELLVNTHHHGDHIGANSYMSGFGTIIFSHDNARRRMAAPYTKPARDAHRKKLDSILKGFGDKISSDETRKDAYRQAEEMIGSAEDMINIPEGSLPVVTFSKNLNFYYNDEKIMLIHLPNSHTDGDVMVYFTKSNVLHTGDAFVKGNYPFIDSENRGSLDGYIRGLTKIMGLVNNDTKIIPGHGDVATKADVKYTLSMLQFLEGKIKYHIVDNKSVEEVLAMSELTKEYDDKGFGEGFITTESFIRTLYSESAKKLGK